MFKILSLLASLWGFFSSQFTRWQIRKEYQIEVENKKLKEENETLKDEKQLKLNLDGMSDEEVRKGLASWGKD